MRHLSALAGTFLLRPYVLFFLLWYLLGSVTKVGWLRTLAFAAIACTASLVAEISSTRSGLPFGLIEYLAATRGEELWVGTVPLWTAFFFTAVCWTGHQMAVLLYSPLELRRGDLQVLDTIAIRRSPRVLVTGAVLVATLGALLDPLELRGDRWFLGASLTYPAGGVYFGVPLSAFGGTLLVALVTIFLYQRLEPFLLTPTPLLLRGQAHLPLGGLVEPLLYLCLVVFGIGVASWLGEQLLAIVGVLVFAPLTLVIATHVLGTASRATAAEREAHRRDFPRGRALG